MKPIDLMQCTAKFSAIEEADIDFWKVHQLYFPLIDVLAKHVICFSPFSAQIRLSFIFADNKQPNTYLQSDPLLSSSSVLEACHVLNYSPKTFE